MESRSGFRPPDTARPTQPVLGSTEGANQGMWKASTRSAGGHGVLDQEWATGVKPLPDGRIPEYMVPNPSGAKDLEFDGFEVIDGKSHYSEIKGNYSWMDSMKPARREEMIGEWADRAEAKLDAMNEPDAVLHWVFTRDEKIAHEFADVVADYDNIVVEYRQMPDGFAGW